MQLIQLQDNLTYCIYMLDSYDKPNEVITLSKLTGNVTTIHGTILQLVRNKYIEEELYCCYKRDEYPKIINL